jgi:hypothetical protein
VPDHKGRPHSLYAHAMLHSLYAQCARSLQSVLRNSNQEIISIFCPCSQHSIEHQLRPMSAHIRVASIQQLVPASTRVCAANPNKQPASCSAVQQAMLHRPQFMGVKLNSPYSDLYKEDTSKLAKHGCTQMACEARACLVTTEWCC